MRVDLPGVASATKTLADGTSVKYYYAWRGGPRLYSEPGTPEFLAEYNAAAKGDKPPVPANGKTVAWLIEQYRNSLDFIDLRPKAKKEYSRYLDMIEAEFGAMTLNALLADEARTMFLDWRDKYAAETRRAADYWMTVCRRLFSWGLNKGHNKVNPCARPGKKYKDGARREIIWSDEACEAFMKCPKVNAVIKLPFKTGEDTGQRLGDIHALRWENYDGKYLRMLQSKAESTVRNTPRKRVIIPVTEELKALLDRTKAERMEAMRAKGVTVTEELMAKHFICLTTYGTPWTLDGWESSWRTARARAECQGLNFHDLRGTAVTRLAIAGCYVPEIVAITGHTMDEANAILERHYLGGTKELADNAINKLQARRKQDALDKIAAVLERAGVDLPGTNLQTALQTG